MEKILAELNKPQREAVVNFNGPSLVIAGAGSGKTRVLTYRIANMLANGIAPHTILALTFTNKAANEMKERIAALVGMRNARQLWMGTFHSIFARILRKEAQVLGYPATFTIYDTQDSRNLVKTIIKELKLDEKIYKPNEVFGRISNAKNNLVTAEAYAANTNAISADNSTRRPMIKDIYKRYAVRCKSFGAMDFDDLLLNTNILFRDHPDILDKYMNIFRYILVDEYQDTNYSQYLIVQKLAREHRNLCVVGDDAQSIYSFRGARIENILRFQSDYPETAVYKLERNYRSTQNIVNAANSIIAKNQGQLQKRVYSEKQEGDRIKVIEAQTDGEEGFMVAGMIRDASLSQQVPYRDIAILYRTNAQSRIFEESLRKMNIPYKVYGGVSFFQRKEVKDVLAYFKVIVNPSDDESMKRIINYPLRGIGKTTLAKIGTTASDRDVPIWDVLKDSTFLRTAFNSGTQQKLQGFVQLIEGFRQKAEEMEAFDLAYTVASTTGILRELGNDKTPEGISRAQNIEELLNSIRDFNENEENTEGSSLSDYLQTVTLYTDADNEKNEDLEKVTLMTVHSAKGLEFSHVFLAGLEEELFPSQMSTSLPKDLEEERRLFYVALTRAREKVTISYAGTRYRWGLLTNCNPSRFISEIDEQYLDLPDMLAARTGPGRRKANPLNPDTQTTPGHLRRRSPATPPPSAPAGKKLSRIDNNPARPSTGNADPSKIQVGMEVEHPRFGRGKVIGKEGSPPNVKATVFFKDHGQKQLLLKFAKLNVVGEGGI